VQRCRHLRPYTSTWFGLCDGAVNKFVTESCHVGLLFLEIRIQRNLCSDTATFFYYFAKPINKAVCNSLVEVEPAVLILAFRLKVITSFFWPSQRVPRLSSAQWTLHRLDVKYAIKPIVWVATQIRVAISQKVRKQVAPRRLKTLNLSCNFSNLSVTVCSVA